MKIKALKSFAGVLTMGKGEIKEYDNKVVLQDLLKCGYIKEVSQKGVNNNESKSNNTN